MSIMTAIPESKAAEQRAHEPSMEEILASIRRIISEDAALPLSPRSAPPSRPFVEPASVSLPLSAPPAPSRPQRPEPAYGVSHRPPEPARPLTPPRLVELQPERPLGGVTYEDFEEPLLSPKANDAVSTSFQALNSARAGLPSQEVMDAMARDLLRPMLKQWLDDNLPSIVERLVRAEIERVARGPR